MNNGELIQKFAFWYLKKEKYEREIGLVLKTLCK